MIASAQVKAQCNKRADECERKINDFGEIQADNHTQGRLYLVVQRRVQEAKTQTFLCSGLCVGQGMSGTVGLWLGGREMLGKTSRTCVLVEVSVPAAWSCRSWEPQCYIPDADRDINFAVQP